MSQVKYRTFDDLMNEVGTDFHLYNLEGMIEPAQLIKVALKLNKELGLKLHMTKEIMLDIEHNKVKLPDDLYVLNYAMLCGEYTLTTPIVAGRQTENIETVSDGVTVVATPCNSGNCNNYQVIETVKYETKTYHTFQKLEIKKNTIIHPSCRNLYESCPNKGEIRNGWLYTNFDHGKLYLTYEGNLEDDDHNLLVLDHDIINEYYEYALKLRILENLYMNGEDVLNKIKYLEGPYKIARTNSLSIVNTPDFADMKAVFDMNRKAMFNKYYRMFSSN